VTVAYQWSAAGTPISGATHPTYVPQAAQRGATLTVTVKGTKTGYAPASRSSTPTPKVATGVLTTATPKISGTAKVGSTLKASPGTWGPAGVSLKYQWYAGSAAIKGQTGKSLKLTTTLVGKRIKVKVTGSKAGYATASRSSAATAPVRR
jgi:hypothetical protein